MEREVASGVASLDDAKLTTSGKDIGSVESSVTDKVMRKFNKQFERKMIEKDKHTINNYESMHTLVKKLEMDFLALKKGRRAVQRVLQQRQRRVEVVEGSTQGCLRKAGGLDPEEIGIGWEDWNDMTSTAVAVEEVFLLLADLWTRMTADVLARFLWEAIDQEQGRFEREKDGVLFGFGQRSAPEIVDVLWMYCRKRPLSEVTRSELLLRSVPRESQCLKLMRFGLALWRSDRDMFDIKRLDNS